MPGRFGAAATLDEVCPGVFVGSVRAVRRCDDLVERGISLVINCADSVTPNDDFRVLVTSDGKDAGSAFPPSVIGSLADAAVQARRDRRVVCVWLRLQDNASQKLTPYFDPIAKLIAASVEAGAKVAVHCMLGVSRSVTLVAAYMLLHRIGGVSTLESTLDQIRSCRPVAQPQPTFCLELFKLERSLAESPPRAMVGAVDATGE